MLFFVNSAQFFKPYSINIKLKNISVPQKIKDLKKQFSEKRTLLHCLYLTAHYVFIYNVWRGVPKINLSGQK